MILIFLFITFNIIRFLIIINIIRQCSYRYDYLVKSLSSILFITIVIFVCCYHIRLVPIILSSHIYIFIMIAVTILSLSLLTLSPTASMLFPSSYHFPHLYHHDYIAVTIFTAISSFPSSQRNGPFETQKSFQGSRANLRITPW